MPRAAVLFALVALVPIGWAQQGPESRKPPLLIGQWKRIDPPPQVTLEFGVDRLILRQGSAITPHPVRYGESSVKVETGGRWIDVKFELVGDALTLHFPEGAWKLERLKEGETDSFEPYPLGEAGELAPEPLDALRREFQRRLALDQEVRQRMMGGGRPDPDVAKEMRRIDADNTRWLIELIAKHGWIDAGRFGSEAANAAFLIVQHSGDLRLMRTALPLIEKDVKAGRLNGSAFALLYDRTMLYMGKKQRYGSQVTMNPATGEAQVLPLEDPERVDEYRKEVGLPPLDAYLEIFRRMARGQRPPRPQETEPEEEEQGDEGDEPTIEDSDG